MEFLLFYLYSFFDKDISEKHDSKTDDVENVDGFSPVKVLKTYQRRRRITVDKGKRSPKHTIDQGIHIWSESNLVNF